MYADRDSGAGKVSVKERLKVAGSGRRRPYHGKRHRQEDDKWVHNLYDNKGPQVLNCRDLRLKLQNKSTQCQTENKGVRDLREKLSGPTNSLQVNTAAPQRRKVAVDSKLARKVIVQVPVQEAKKVTSTMSISKKKTVQKAETVDSFLQSLGLEKYSLTFQVEEIDMAAILHMNDADLKDLSIPMGPRKKILLALDSKL
ncbi:SAM domain-containing protein [Heracleum sosnowskyi]|uniref:SAM domain-containing protein n=1 Tax=Heracleum sosnowskyi TaxID=360622 RepID=A0AAD8GXI7_9APIA|nr:SAM domain-containing protein [Heracleum sosnowskyi]